MVAYGIRVSGQYFGLLTLFLLLQMQQKLYVASTSGLVTALEIKVLETHSHRLFSFFFFGYLSSTLIIKFKEIIE